MVGTLSTFTLTEFDLKFPSPAGVFRLVSGDGPMPPENKPILNAQETAEWLGLSTSTLAKMRLAGSGPIYRKLGRRVVYHREDLEDWIAERRCRSTSEYQTSAS